MATLYDQYLLSGSGTSFTLSSTTVVNNNGQLTDAQPSGGDGILGNETAAEGFTSSKTTDSFTYYGVATDSSTGTVIGFVAYDSTDGNYYLFVWNSGTAPTSGETFTVLTNTTTSDGGTQWDIATHAQNCFLAETLIRTPDGEVAVEALKPGDLVLTADGRVVPVRWIGRQTVSRLFADPVRSLPIRIKAGALGDNLPARDLCLSRCHAVLIDGILATAGALVNGSSIERMSDAPPVFTYYHIELDRHDLVIAEGMPCESFVDYVDRMSYDNWAEREALGLGDAPIEEMPYPRARGGRQVPMALRRRLAERAAALADFAAAA